MTEIICGSKKYDNICLDKLVDSFDIITRHNMLLSDMGYGKKEATFQVCNSHVYQHYKNKTEPEELYEDYSDHIGLGKWHSKNIKMKHMIAVSKFFKISKAKFLNYGEQNNWPRMLGVISDYNISHSFSPNAWVMKVGLSHVAECVKNGVKPFLIGYSLIGKDLNKHAYTKHVKLYDGHDHEGEVELLKKLHNAGLIDATLCLIKDESIVSLSDEIEPTEEGLRIIDDNLR